MGSDPKRFEGLLGVLSTLKDSSVWELKISGFPSFTYSATHPAFNFPSVNHLDLQAGADDVESCFRDEVRWAWFPAGARG